MATFTSGGLAEQVNVTATAAGTTTLVGSTSSSSTLGKQIQVFTGTSTQTVVLPNATTMQVGQKFEIINQSTGALTLQFNGGSAFTDASGASYGTIPSLDSIFVILQTNGTSAGTWAVLSPSVGGGAVTPTVTTITSGSGTFTTPSGALYLQVKMVGGGGGGDGTAGGAGGGIGTASTFGPTGNPGMLTCNPGTRITGGTATASSPATAIIAVQGGSGTAPATVSNGGNQGAGGSGAASPFGGAGGGSASSTVGESAVGNTGSGGGGAGGTAVAVGGYGGGAGGYVDAIITSPGISYSYTVGTGGSAGSAGGGGAVGGAGGSGYIEVTTYYNNGAVGTATNVTGIVAIANGGTGQPSGAYANTFFPGSSSNYWSLTSSTYADFTPTGTIPAVTVQQSSGLTISAAASSLPGITFTPTYTGILEIMVTATILPGQSATSTLWNLRLYESITAAVVDVVSVATATNAVNDSLLVFLKGYFSATGGTAYTFKIQGKTSANTLFIGASGTQDSCLGFRVNYVH